MGHCKLVQIPDPWIEGLYYHRPNYIQPPYLLNNSPKSYQHCCTLKKTRLSEKKGSDPSHVPGSLAPVFCGGERGKTRCTEAASWHGSDHNGVICPSEAPGAEEEGDGEEGEKVEEKETVPRE